MGGKSPGGGGGTSPGNGTEHGREDNPDLYYWAEITEQQTQSFNI